MESLFLTIAIVGFMEMVKAIQEQQWDKVAIIVGSAGIGCIVGYFGIDGLTITSGIQAGLSASGIYRIGRIAGGRN